MPRFEPLASQSPPVPLFMAQTLSESSLVPAPPAPPAIGVLSAPSCIADVLQEINIGSTSCAAQCVVTDICQEVDIGVSSAPPCVVTDVHQEINISVPAPPTIADVQDNVLDSIYIFLTLSFTSDTDVEYVEVYEDEQLYALIADAMADECMIYYHHGTLYNVPAKSAQLGVNPPFFCVTWGHYIGFFSRWHVVETMVEGIENAVYVEVNSIEDGERAVRRAIERGEIVKFPQLLENKN